MRTSASASFSTRLRDGRYIEGELGLSPEVTKFVEPVVGLICGASPDAVCARAGHSSEPR